MSFKPGDATKQKRSRVTRADGKSINVVQRRGHLTVCATGCCCGKTARGFAPVPKQFYKEQWLARKLRHVVHLTQGGCLGPCALANVVLFIFDGCPVWFHSVATEQQIVLIFDYIEAMLAADSFLPPPLELEGLVFNFYDWDGTQGVADVPSHYEGEADSILFLSHADTDLLTLQQTLPNLPEDFPLVQGVNLLSLTSEAKMRQLIAHEGSRARLMVLRILGRPSSVAGFHALRKYAEEAQKPLIVISGTGEISPELSAASTVSPQVVQEVTAYVQEGGIYNMQQVLHYLADHLLMTGYGYGAVREVLEHGIYHPSLPEQPELSDWQAHATPNAPTIGILFYRSHWLSGNTAFIDSLVNHIEARGANALPIYTTSLKDKDDTSQPKAFAFFRQGTANTDVVINTMSFALSDAGQSHTSQAAPHPLREFGVPMLQAITSGMRLGQWEASPRGLNPLDTAMNVALPEFDGRLIGPPLSFKTPTKEAQLAATHYAPVEDRAASLAAQALRLANLKHTPNPQKRIAFVLTNSNSKASQIGNAVGLDAPASLMALLEALQARGYDVKDLPENGDALIHALIERCAYDEIYLTETQLSQAHHVSHDQYMQWFEELGGQPRARMVQQWGEAPGEAYVHDGKICLAGIELGNIFIALQPPRGYGMDPDLIYHMPDLPPPHHYYALYRWLRDVWGADALVHLGKHGTLEWLPGKGVGLSSDCFPDSFLGDMPLFYPFILNDPGEGTQAKRRSHACIVDHLTPAMTQAGVYGELAELAQLVDEYYQVEMLDPSKLPLIQEQIWHLLQSSDLGTDLGLLLRRDHGDHVHEWDDELTPEGIPVTLSEMSGSDVAHLIEDIDAYLCELGAAQIRDGLHTLGKLPEGQSLIDLLHALTRLSNIDVPSLPRSVAELFGLDYDLLDDHKGKRAEAIPDTLHALASQPLATHADILDLIDELSGHLLALLQDKAFEVTAVPEVIQATFPHLIVAQDHTSPLHAVLRFICMTLFPNLTACDQEIMHLLDGLEGHYIPAGPSGAPTRGMAHVLPTGRNFYAVDPRALPSMAAWKVGQGLAHEVVQRYVSETGAYPESVGISVWGTSAMRTQGDDAAQVMALIGVKPRWHAQNKRVIGYEVIELEALGRPRIDVTVRMSGFFRDAFPHLIDLLDEATEAVMLRDEPPEQNYLRKHYLEDLAKEIANGIPEDEAEQNARYRLFGAKPGSYGAGILPLIHEQNWQDEHDFARAYLNWGGYAYTRFEQGIDAREVFTSRLQGVQVAVHNQDNREHDIFDSDDYLQFHGGMIATIRALTGKQPKHYFGDSHNPDKPQVRDLKEEVLRVYRSRVINPKWIESIQKHGYKGGLELTATLDYLFGFDATAQVMEDWMYENVAQAYTLDSTMQDFLNRSNPWALQAMSERLLEAEQRGMWHANPETLAALKQLYLQTEHILEGP